GRLAARVGEAACRARGRPTVRHAVRRGQGLAPGLAVVVRQAATDRAGGVLAGHLALEVVLALLVAHLDLGALRLEAQHRGAAVGRRAELCSAAAARARGECADLDLVDAHVEGLPARAGVDSVTVLPEPPSPQPR